MTMLYLLLVFCLVSLQSIRAQSGLVKCPFPENHCKCSNDPTGRNETFAHVVCRICGTIDPFKSSIDQFTVTGEMTIVSVGCDITVPANAFLAFHNINQLSFENTNGPKKLSFDTNAFNGSRIDGLTTSYFDGMLPIPDAVRRLGRDGLNTLIVQNVRGGALNDNEFQDFRNLTTLAFIYVELKSIATDAFAGLEQTLTNLTLNYNELMVYRADVLNRLTKLKQLELSYNKLQTIPRDVFTNFPDLVNVDLRYNAITKLSADSFPRNNKITFLSLTANPITNIDNGAFDTLAGLKNLELKGLKLTSLDLSIFQALNNLQTINFESSTLDYVNATDKVPVATTQLVLSYSTVKLFHESAAKLVGQPDFKFLDLMYLSIPVCDGTIDWMAKYVLCQPVRINAVTSTCKNLQPIKTLDSYLKDAVPNPCQ